MKKPFKPGPNDCYVDDETQHRRELRLIRPLIDRWTHLRDAGAPLTAFVAVSVACPHHQSHLVTATRRLAPHLVEGALQRHRSAWWRSLAKTDPLLCLRIALETRLRTDAQERSLGPRDPNTILNLLRAETIVDTWTSLDRLGVRAATELTDALLNGVGPAPLSEALRHLAPALRGGALRCGPHGHREWIVPVARFHPFLALKIGVEAALRQDVDLDLSEWTEPVLTSLPARRRPRRRARPCLTAA